MGRIFGTDGVRGVANTELTAQLAFRLGMAGVQVLSREKAKPVFLIGRDTRISGDMLEDALSSGILSMGGDVIKAGVIPTPAVAHLVKDYKADAGVVISASHNPFEYNGIKFFNGGGFKLDDAIEDEIEAILEREKDENERISGAKLGRTVRAEAEAARSYVDFLVSSAGVGAEGMKLVLDCANGAAYDVAGRVFQALGAEVVIMGNAPDGRNINAACGSTHPEALAQMVVREGADMGLAFDGDADRLIAIDEKGRIVDGDKIMYVCARAMKMNGELDGELVTATVMSNMGFGKAIEKIGCKVQYTGVGDRYVLEQMLKTGSVLGGEQSGHIIFLKRSTTGDGILAGLQLMKSVASLGMKLSELADHVTVYPQVLKNARVRNENKERYMDDKLVRDEIVKMQEDMAEEGRVLIRPSGTEPLVRVMLEGRDIKKITCMAEKLAELITEKLG
ncbi:MAG: phosphoglucosamine mutase [Clostridiales Family XIII bacterium]|nr:phosphoglucosamine mutase [Clostridiales Family XIII bacterium]